MQTAAETFDGTDWSTAPSLATARARLSMAGITTAAVAIAGQTPSLTGATEEFTSSVNVITGGAWASGGNMPQDSRGGGSAGTQNAAYYVGGLQYPTDTKKRTDEYDGTSWTNVNNIPETYGHGNSCGTLTAGLIWGSQTGYDSVNKSWEYDGTNWTAGGALSPIGPAYQQPGGGGTQTAAVSCGGYGDPPPAVTNVVEYNGSSWSANPNALPSAQYAQAGDGTASALWLSGGYESPQTATFHFDGTSFTTSGAMATARPSAIGGGYGPQTSAIVAGGEGSGTSTQGEQYNGTSWVSAPSLSQGRKYGEGASRSAGSQTGFIAGGATPPSPNTNLTEEYTPETSAINVKTLTQS
jgi:hypothetical protein